MITNRIAIIVSFLLACGATAIGFRKHILDRWYQWRAERFLDTNIIGYGWTEDHLLNPRTGDTILFTPYDYKTLYRAKDTLDSLRRIYRATHTVHRDADLLSPELRRQIVRTALERWQGSPYARGMSFADFCEYLLPYRAGKEPFDRRIGDTIRIRYAHLLDSAGNDPIVAASLINNDIKDWMIFDLRSHALLNEPSISELMAEGKGSCRAISALFVQIMRELGIPAAIDECPAWAHRNSGHEWTVVRDTTGRWQPFEPAEFNPDGFRSVCENTRTPKIFRRTYSFDPTFYPPVEPGDIPPLFTTFNRKDVTAQYVPVSDVTVAPNQNLDKNNGILYLAVFNAAAWQPVAWAPLRNGTATFTDMGNNDILYLPIFYRSGRNYPAGRPFVLTSSGHKREILPDSVHTQHLDMEFVNLYWTVRWDTFYPADRTPLEIYHWADNDWHFCDSCRVGMPPNYEIHFEGLPVGGLYLIRGTLWDNTWQRPFMADSTSTGSVWY
ncbi:transglutaminase-like domain-containing protein [uncultured Rikenella sp.]|uniref:transglutaminase-like domain-containing protein n=1 Tax=uncultured Rikenella sp. TaxID=368003 RepID=UPI0025E4AC85|nr:transglutaminase-like domain-containing protein [uncultured Rikenella sp.]